MSNVEAICMAAVGIATIAGIVFLAFMAMKDKV